MLKWLARGALLGAMWGVAARVFMRLLTTDPEFSWSGTLMIVGVSAMVGACLGIVHGARIAGRNRWWKLAAVPSVMLFLGPGMLLLPGVVVTAIGVCLRRPVLRASFVLVAAAGTFALPPLVDDTIAPTLHFVAGLTLMTLCALALGAVGFAELGRPRVVRSDRTGGLDSALLEPLSADVPR